jgi:hypothetical protein
MIHIVDHVDLDVSSIDISPSNLVSSIISQA